MFWMNECYILINDVTPQEGTDTESDWDEGLYLLSEDWLLTDWAQLAWFTQHRAYERLHPYTPNILVLFWPGCLSMDSLFQ